MSVIHMDTSNKPTVSIILAVYNRPVLLQRALLSLQNQTYTNWECIIVDDGSTDTTSETAQEFVEKDPRFVLLKEKHQGDIQARNIGISHAKGEYITRLDSDDAYDPDHLELRVNALENNPAIDMLHGGFRVIGDLMVPDKNDMTQRVSLLDPSIYFSGTIFARKKVFEHLGGFKVRKYGSGSDFIEEAMQQFTVKKVDWPTYLYYRDHGTATTDKLLQGK